MSYKKSMEESKNKLKKSKNKNFLGKKRNSNKLIDSSIFKSPGKPRESSGLTPSKLRYERKTVAYSNKRIEDQQAQDIQKRFIRETQKNKTIKESLVIDRKEYLEILSDNKEELQLLGVDLEENSCYTKIKNNEHKSLVSDFANLYLDLFSHTKFENSKPYKMIDYILNNDPKFLSSQTDRFHFEELKKTVFNKIYDFSDNSSVLFKPLYQYFKSDFSTSYISKVFEKANFALIDKLKENNNTNNNENLSITQSSIYDKKDKFTYQNYLSDKLKNNCNIEYVTELLDSDLFKSLIYLCNKNLRIPSKNLFKIYNPSLQNLNNLKSPDNLFFSVIKENYDRICKEEIGLKVSDLCKAEAFIKFKKILTENKNFNKFMIRRLNRLLKSTLSENKIIYKDNDISKKVYLKAIELIIKNKEDDFEKISAKLMKYESDLIEDINNSNRESNLLNLNDNRKTELSNIKSFWFQFKFLFYLQTIMLNKSYITDEGFWKAMSDFFNNENSKYDINAFISKKTKGRK